MKKAALRYGALATGAVLAVTACSGSSGSGSTGGKKGTGGSSGGSVTLTINGEPTTLDPQARDDGNLRAVDWNIYERLMDRSATGELIPGLAESAPTHTNPTTWQVKLRPNITFTNGEPMNADAVVFSINRMINPKYNSELLGSIDTITGATKVDDLTVDIKTKAPDPILPSRLAFIAIMPPTAGANASIKQKPIGTGPYELVTWQHGDHVTLKANPDYWGTKPSISQVTFTYPEESGTRLASLLSGKTDLVTNLLPEDAKSAPQVLTAPGQQHAVIVLNAKAGSPLADVRVRQAMNYAVDTSALAKNLFEGYAKPDACEVLSSSWTGYNPSLDPSPYAYDAAKAKQLIKDAGATGTEVTLVGESGRWLKDRDFTEAVAQYWRDAGLKVNTQILQFNQYLDKLFTGDNRPDAVIVYHDNALYDADRTFSTFYTGSGGGSNDSTQIADLVEKQRSELNADKRSQELQQVAKIGCDQALFYFGLQVEDLYGASDRLEFTPRVDSELYVKDMSLKS